jgi:hypothetical protein
VAAAYLPNDAEAGLADEELPQYRLPSNMIWAMVSYQAKQFKDL